ncbi:MAG: hypothetical protein IKC54_01955 [Clostridia bacterium]|nr:hypothetical protein [Clostridia bacterium]
MKKTAIAILSTLLVALLLVSLVGCMKVTMTEKSILSRLEKEEYTIMAGHSIIPMSDPAMSGLKIKKTIYAYKMDTTVHEEYGDVPSAVWEVAIYFMDDTDSANKLEDFFKDLAKQYDEEYDKLMQQLENGEFDLTIQFPKRYMVYRYDDIVVLGDWESVTLVRSY